MKTKSKNNRRATGESDDVLRRLKKMPETAHQIYELAESLYLRDDGAAGRMTHTEIERVNNYLRQTENDHKAMQKQFQDLATVEGGFQTEKIPIGF